MVHKLVAWSGRTGFLICPILLVSCKKFHPLQLHIASSILVLVLEVTLGMGYSPQLWALLCGGGLH